MFPQYFQFAKRPAPAIPPSTESSPDPVPAHPPKRSRHGQPQDSSQGESKRGWIPGEGEPCCTSEAQHSPSTGHRTRCIEGRGLPASLAAIDTGFTFFLGLVALDESHRCREDRGEGQEETPDHRAPMLSDEACAQRHCTSENEAHHELMPARVLEAREVETRNHGNACSRSPAPAATSAQIPRLPSATGNGGQRAVASSRSAT